ncbi:HigA family addiction module antitoxin [Catenovulum sp. SX2]|uniref:HigA family addiction module antitoxin n=1 Tax=Catenovulum TaxID=1172191 RepID=UPI00031CE0FA|nr:HigA family addiction module antitoxin [Catenovulum agarivorans]
MSIVRSNKLPAQHPGAIFKKRILDRHKITIVQAAKLMHVNRPHLNNFVNGKVSVTAPLAYKLERSTGINAAFWLSLQTKYDLYVNSNLEVEAEPLYAFG